MPDIDVSNLPSSDGDEQSHPGSDASNIDEEKVTQEFEVAVEGAANGRAVKKKPALASGGAGKAGTHKAMKKKDVR